MVVDGTVFLRRAHIFFREIKGARFPNSNSLAGLCNCSKNTAQRTIYRLRDEYLVPIDYDQSEKGYFLTDPEYVFPALLPPGKDELTALLLARDILGTVDAEDVRGHLDSLWNAFVSTNRLVGAELEPLIKYFSSDATVIGDIADQGLIQYVMAASAGENVEIRYKSPWRKEEAKVHQGRLLRVHLSDGQLYLLMQSVKGRQLVLNAAFIKEFTVLNEDLTFEKLVSTGKPAAEENWLDGFGIWAGEEIVEVEVHIAHPASEYYASQRWHAEQADEWQGDVLVRRMKAMLSPELVRRVLSLGRYVKEVRPEALRKLVIEDLAGLEQALGK